MTLAPGTRLGPYEISGPIGAGGMGEVYRARDTRLDRTVAIKVLRGGAPASEDSRRRLIREARSASALNHPHIVAIYDIGSEAGVDFIAMEHVAGVPLRAPSEGMPLERALDCAIQITSALAAAHEAGLVHRDIKPGNLLVTTSGDVKVVDFGLAKAIVETDADAVTLTVPATLTAVGAFCGTPGYAAPEQVEGRAADARSDVFAIGAVLYELLSGRRAFDGGSPASRVASVLEREPSPLAQLRRDVPRDLARVVSRCLEKQPGRRYSSAVPLLADLTACRAKLTSQRAGLRGLLRRPLMRVAAVVLVLAAFGGVAWAWVRQSRITWARTQALPEATRLIGQRAHFAAFRLLREAERYIPADPLLQQLIRESTDVVTITTTPPGADVYARDFLDPPSAWELVGRSPINGARVPAWALVWKVSAPGSETIERMGYTSLSPIEFTLRAHKDVPAGMIDVPQHVGAGSADYFWIDKFEVTNREFKRFVDLGGYARPGHWTAALAETGSLTFETAQRTFRDRTGRPGPAGWELGTYTERTDDHPVGGVSWYEAAAYCTFAGKHLPSADHWRAAAAFEATSDFAWHGRFGADGPAPVGGPLALGYYGTYDMAGNVKEWTWNRVAGDRRRYVLGGGWNEPTYAFAMIDAQPPAERLPAYGFRCAKYVGAIDPALLAPIPELAHDFRHDTPVDDKTFAMIRRWYQYDAGSLDARLERHQPLFDGVRVEQVSFTAAYGNDRVPALLFLPTRGAPPYQAVVYLPAVNVMSQPGPFGFVEGEQHWFMFLVRSGRAVIVPIYYGAFGRGTPQIRHGDTSPGLRSQEVVTRASMDVGRTVDYLATRRDIDASRLAFFGLSSSAALGPLVTAMEPRFKVSILLGGGLWDSGPPETSSFNFLPRVTAATLMINGRHDFIFPPETSQIPMFERLGTTDKKHTVFESGHLPNEWHEVMKAALDWLDGHLGSVAQVGAGP